MRRRSFDNKNYQKHENFKYDRDFLGIEDNSYIKEQDEYSRQLRDKVRDLRMQHKSVEIAAKQMQQKTQKYDYQHLNNIKYIKGNPYKKRYNYIETYNNNMLLLAEREKEKEIELNNQREQNQIIHAHLHKKIDQKIEARLAKAQKEGMISKLQKEYNQELKEYYKIQELMKAKQNASVIRANVSTFHQNRFNEMMKTRTNHIEELENTLLYENQKLEIAQKKADLMSAKQNEAENLFKNSYNQREKNLVYEKVKNTNLESKNTRKTSKEF